jgi:hypothetical protein
LSVAARDASGLSDRACPPRLLLATLVVPFETSLARDLVSGGYHEGLMASTLDREEQRAAEAVRAWLSRQQIGSLRPVDVQLRRDEDSAGQEAWFFEVTLADPEPNAGTWPSEDLAELDRATRDEALRLGLSWPWYVLFRPETDEPQADEDDPGLNHPSG